MSAPPSVQIWVVATSRWRRYGAAAATTRIRQRRWSRRRARLVLGLAITIAASVVAPAAIAADGQGTNPWLNPFAIKDSSGLTVDQYSLSLGGDDGFSGQAVADAVNKILAMLLWDLYRMFVAIGLWILDWGLRFEVVGIVSDGATRFAAALSTTIGRLAVVGTLLAASALYFVHTVNRGQLAKGVVAFLASFLMAALVQSPQVSIIDAIAGKDGAIVHSRDLGMAMAVDITTAGQAAGAKDEDALRQATVAKIADVVMRIPHQIINYGAVMDGTCRPVYDEAVKAGAGTDEARTKVGDCNEAYKKAADNPMQAATGLFFVVPGGGIILLLGLILAIGLALMCVIAMFEAAGLVWQLLKAIIPGQTRSHVFESLAVVGTCLITIIGVIFCVGLLVVTIDAVFKGGNTNPVIGFVLLDITLTMAACFAFVAFVKARKRGQKLGRTFAAGLSPNASTGERAQPLRQLGQMVAGSATAAWAVRRGHGAATDGAPAEGADAGSPQLSAAERLQRKLGQGAKVTAQAAGFALKGTIGAPVYVPRAVGHIKTAASTRKAATTTKLAAARSKAGQKGQEAREFSSEYVGNLAAGGRWVSRTSASAADRIRGRQAAYGPETAAGPGMRARQPRTEPPPSSFPRESPARPRPPAGTGTSRPPETGSTPRSGRAGRRGPVTVESLTREAGLQPTGSGPSDGGAQRLRDRVAIGKSTLGPTPKGRP